MWILPIFFTLGTIACIAFVIFAHTKRGKKWLEEF